MQNKKTKSKNNIRLLVILIAIISNGTFLLNKNGKADNSISNLDQQANTDSDTQSKIDELQRRADMYRQIIDMKRQQGDTLNNQLTITNANIEQVQGQINLTSEQINDYNSQIIRLSEQIKEKENIIANQKLVLAQMMQAYYSLNQNTNANNLLFGDKFVNAFGDADQLSQTGDKIVELVDSVMQIKSSLEAQSAELDQKKASVVVAQENLQNQSSNLQKIKDQRVQLLEQTKGEEAKYKELLARVEEQKQQLLDIDQYFAASGLSVDSYPKPDAKYAASTDWYYSQRDPRWGNENIGNTKTLMKSYGCAVTAVAMVFKQHGGSMTPGDLANAPIFSGDLINWPQTWNKPQVSLTSNGFGHGNINWSIVDQQIAKGNPVIVYIGKTKGGGGHYVVIHHKVDSGEYKGQYVVHDPYFGPNLFLNTSRALVGAMGVDSGTTMNQMIIYN